MKYNNFLAAISTVAAVILFSFSLYAQDSLTAPGNKTTVETLPVVSEGLTGNDVLNNYIEAIGGRDAFSSVKDRTTIMRGEMMGQAFSIVMKQKFPDKLKQVIRFGDTKQEVIFDGKKAVQKVGDKKKEITGKQLNALSREAHMDFILNPEAYAVNPVLDGVEKVDSIFCYKVKMSSDSSSNDWYQYFSIDDGLKIKETKNVDTQQGSFMQETYFADYKDVDGVKYPFKIKQSFGMQSMELNVSSVKVNKGLKDKVFLIEE